MSGDNGFSRVTTSLRGIRGLQDGSPVIVGGRVRGVRDLGAVTFWVLAWDGAEVQVVAHGIHNVRRQDIVEISGTVTVHDGRAEISLDQVLRHQRAQDRQPAAGMHLLEPNVVPTLRLRSEAEMAIRYSLEQLEYIPVRSPGIVGDWVEGQTGAFEIDYYRRRAHLTISNMLAHQLLLGAGFSKIYEIGPIYRAEHPPNRRRLAEFTMVDMSRSFADLSDLLADVEKVMRATMDVLHTSGASLAPVEDAAFPTISYSEVLRRSNLDHTTGSQLPSKARDFLTETFPGFVWVTHFPEHTRPFFVRADEGICIDAQLWYGGVIYLAAGGERETSIDEMVRRIESEGKDPVRYEFFLRYLRSSLPRSTGMGFGLERLLGAVTGASASDYAAFPAPIGALPKRGIRNS